MVMLDGLLTPAILGNGGLVTIVLSAVWMIFTGRLVTRREADGIKEERDYWRAAFKEEQKQTSELLETARVTRATMKALPRPPDEEPS